MNDIKLLLRVLKMYIPLPVFWALFHQQVRHQDYFLSVCTDIWYYSLGVYWYLPAVSVKKTQFDIVKLWKFTRNYRENCFCFCAFFLRTAGTGNAKRCVRTFDVRKSLLSLFSRSTSCSHFTKLINHKPRQENCNHTILEMWLKSCEICIPNFFVRYICIC